MRMVQGAAFGRILHTGTNTDVENFTGNAGFSAKLLNLYLHLTID
jgi:hypothetical protein